MALRNCNKRISLNFGQYIQIKESLDLIWIDFLVKN